MNQLSPSIGRRTRTRGFTLVEVMLSVALMIILLAGVNYIFSTSADAVSAGQAISSMSREDRSAQPVLFNDLYSVAKDPPFFVIENRGRIQYLNAQDQLTSPDPSVMVMDNLGTQQQVNPVLYGSRSHRVDVLQFFAHTLYQRRTSDDQYYANFSFGNDIYVHIGHGAMPANDMSAYYGPEDQKAPVTIPPSITGAYASDWTLLRTAILLKDPNNIAKDLDSPPPTHPINQKPVAIPYTGPWNPEVYYPRQLNGPAGLTWTPASPTSPVQNWPGQYLANLTPFSWYCPDITATNPGYPGTIVPVTSFFGDSRYDLAGVSLEALRRICADNILQQANFTGTQNSRYPLWCAPLLYSCPYAPSTGIGDPIIVSSGQPWQWDWRTSSTSHDSTYPINNRFRCNPMIPAPLTAGGVAQAAPFFTQHCTQFIVEYAGDYLTQSADGTIQIPTSPRIPNIVNGQYSVQPDGQIDFYIDPTTGLKHIRWYGFPRKTTSASVSSGIRGYHTGDTMANSNVFEDVIPLSDYLCLMNNVNLSSGTAQRVLAPQEVDCNFLPCADYAASGTTIVANNSTNRGTDSRYACAWYNNTPAMVRILMKVDDPNNRVQDGPWFEYIFKLK